MLFTQLNRFEEHDRTVLLGDDAYKEYFAYMHSVFEDVLYTYHLDAEGKQDEVALLQYFLVRLLNSINCLGTKYLFEVDFRMKIDESDSSYPNSYEFQSLSDDIEQRSEKLIELKSKDVLIKELIQSIYSRKSDLVRIQRELAIRTYYENLVNPDSLFTPFTRGKLTLLKETEERVSYSYTWGIFEDTLSIPMVFQLLFEVQKDFIEKNKENWFNDFQKYIFHASKNLNVLLDTAKYIDRNCEYVYPKSIKRLTIGPLYGKYSKTDAAIADFLYTLNKPQIFALDVQSETVSSISEKQKVMQKKPYQEFGMGRTKEMMLRQVTDYRSLLFTPHDVGQMIISEPNLKLEIQNYTVISLLKQHN